MSFKLLATELRKALADIEEAEANGFMHCEAVFQTYGVDGVFTVLKYSDLWEKAHPTDMRLDWGRFQNVTKRRKFVNGGLV